MLGCRFADWRVPRDWRKLAIGPYGAIGEVFLLPDRDHALERVDGESTGIECGRPMRGAYGNENTGLANLEAPETMGYGDTVDGKFFVELGGDLRDLGQSHAFVGLIVEVESAAAMGFVADAAVERGDGAIFGTANVADQRGSVDGLAHEEEQVIGGRRGWSGHMVLAAADRRQKGNFVTGMERRSPGGKFLVA